MKTLDQIAQDISSSAKAIQAALVDAQKNRDTFTRTLQYRSRALEAGAVVHALGAARLFHVGGQNTSAADVYIQVHDADREPPAGAIPELSFIAFQGANFGVDFAAVPWQCQRGIWVGVSTTADKLTLGSAIAWFWAQFLPEVPA